MIHLLKLADLIYLLDSLMSSPSITGRDTNASKFHSLPPGWPRIYRYTCGTVRYGNYGTVRYGLDL
jgi:hypothetical protein